MSKTTPILKYEHELITRNELNKEEFEELANLNEEQNFGELHRNGIKLKSYAGYIGLSSGTVIQILPKPARLRSSNEENRKIAFHLFLTLVAGSELENLESYVRFLSDGLFLSRKGVEPEETIVEVPC